MCASLSALALGLVLPLAVGSRPGDDSLVFPNWALRISPSGVMSAGNGAAMRAAVVGVFFHDRPEQRLSFGRALAQVTHRDDRAVEGALFVAELAARLAARQDGESLEVCASNARRVVTNIELGDAIDRAEQLAAQAVSTAEAARICGTTGFVLHTVPFAVFLHASIRRRSRASAYRSHQRGR